MNLPEEIEVDEGLVIVVSVILGKNGLCFIPGTFFNSAGNKYEGMLLILLMDSPEEIDIDPGTVIGLVLLFDESAAVSIEPWR